MSQQGTVGGGGVGGLMLEVKEFGIRRAISEGRLPSDSVLRKPVR